MKIVLLGVQLTSLVNFRGPLIRDLVAAGHEVVALAPEPVEPWRGRLDALGARYIEAPLGRTRLNPLADLAFLFWLGRVLREERPDVFFAFQAKAVIYGILAATLMRVPRRVAMIEGLGLGFAPPVPGEGWKRRVARLMVPLLYRPGLAGAHAVLFLNGDDEADFRKRGLLRRGQAVVRIPGIGVDTTHYGVAPLPPAPPFVCLMVARLLVDKGVRIYAEAARRVKAEMPDVRFILLGPFDPGPAGLSRTEVEAWQAEGILTYAGETADVRPFLAACHVFILPTTYREGFPRSTLEAMATGRAIITTDVPGAREAVTHGINGLIVPPGDGSALAAAIKELIRQPNWVTAFGTASRRRVEQEFEVGRINRRILAVLTGDT